MRYLHRKRFPCMVLAQNPLHHDLEGYSLLLLPWLNMWAYMTEPMPFDRYLGSNVEVDMHYDLDLWHMLHVVYYDRTQIEIQTI